MRTDIQSLRGIAVLMVLIYHADLDVLKAGYLGVDIFFVISGYLITGMIVRDIDAHRFSFMGFYWRRAKRLLPAAYVTFLLTSIASGLLLTRFELLEYWKQLFGAITFSANIVLMRQTGYFDGAAELKPLLHTWSLSLEEQYYLLLPLFLWLAPLRFRKALVLAGVAASLALCLFLISVRPGETFYLLPTRAWELLIGSWGAVWLKDGRFGALARPLGVAAVLALVAIPLYPIDPRHPRLDALLACVATLVAIGTRPALLERGPLAALLSRVGDVSYSLYLVHWPILALTRSVRIDEVPTALKLANLLLSIVLAAAIYRFIENPIHRSSLQPTRGTLGVVGVSSVAIVVIPALFVAGSGSEDWVHLRRVNFGFGQDCEYVVPFEPRTACRNVERPKVLVWGDSNAMHLVPGLAAHDGGLGVMQATRSTCGPLLDMAPTNARYTENWARSCLAFNRSVVAYLQATPSVEYVVLSSYLVQYLDPGYRTFTMDGIEPASVARAAAGLTLTVQTLRSIGKKVVIVSPLPAAEFDAGLCIERLRSGLPSVGGSVDCTVDARAYREKRKDLLALLDGVAGRADVAVIRLDELLCDSRTCATQDGDIPIYRDRGHFSHAGSAHVVGKYGLVQRIVSESR